MNQHSNNELALLTERRYEASTASHGDWYLANILRDDELLMDALRELGVTARRVDWSHSGINWSHLRCAIFRTTWDYFDRFAEFIEWLDKTASQTQLFNEPHLIRWNVDKHYLADLARAGLPVVPTRYVERGEGINIRQQLDAFDSSEIVIKPCVSGAARHTYRVSAANAAETEVVINKQIESEAFLVQPFQFDVLANGEASLMVFGGRFTHAIRKLPKHGDFRVQDDHGGTVHPYVATPAEIQLAERAMAACQSLPIYGRADVIRDNDGQLAIMELELIEPELWLRFHPPAATAFAQEIVKRL